MLFFDFFRGERPPLIEQALADMVVMLDTGLQMFDDATASLLENEILESDLYARDEIINNKEIAIRRAVLEHIAIDPRREMIFSLVLISIVQDAERIGDLAKSIAEITELAEAPRHGDHVRTLRALCDRLRNVFEETRRAFVEADEALARKAMDESVLIKKGLYDFTRAVATDKSLTPNLAVVLAVGSRMISRVSSHLSNIASSVAMPFDHIRRPPGWE